MDTPAKQDAEQTTDAGATKLELNKETVQDLGADGGQDVVRGGAAADTNNCSELCPTAFCVTRR